MPLFSQRAHCLNPNERTRDAKADVDGQGKSADELGKPDSPPTG